MIRYVKRRGSSFTTSLFTTVDGGNWSSQLLWGDRVQVLDQSGARWRIKARGRFGFVDPAHLGSESLLEFYFIDVGQGDGVLIRTPDHRHILIDGGWPRRNQPSGKNAADFVDWKFAKDYGDSAIRLDAMICSHNDQDHYGGLWDLLDANQHFELDLPTVQVEAFYHAGLSWWRGNNGNATLGPYESTSDGSMWTRLLDDRASVQAALSGSGPQLRGEWASFLREVLGARTAAGDPTPISRLTHADGVLPGFDGSGGVTIHVLGPVEFDVGGKPGIRRFSGGTSQNTNGNSVLLRVDYGGARILLTGDLNLNSQTSLLADYAGQHHQFEADIAKACHHGSADVSMQFLQAIHPSCTVISSGDSEGHDHPRPNILAACGITGFRKLEGDRIVLPLVYCTELARSVGFGTVRTLDVRDSGANSVAALGPGEMGRARVSYRALRAGDRNPRTFESDLQRRKLAADFVYGLINVRTDGQRIMCAALNEKSPTWNITSFDARFASP